MKLLDKKVSSRFLYQRPDYMAERGWDGRCAAPKAAAPLLGSNRVRKPIPHSAGKQNGPRKGAHFCFLAAE